MFDIEKIEFTTKEINGDTQIEVKARLVTEEGSRRIVATKKITAKEKRGGLTIEDGKSIAAGRLGSLAYKAASK